jgi:hypothetical protein
LCPRAARVLEYDENFCSLQFRCHQIYDVHDLATPRRNIPISISAFARGFSSNCPGILSALAHGLEPPEMRRIMGND